MTQPYDYEMVEQVWNEAASRYGAVRLAQTPAWTRNTVMDTVNALPVRDGWQACSFSDIRKGDRVRAILSDGDVFEFKVTAVDEMVAEGEHVMVDRDTLIPLFRVPAPVTHPDPAEHPVILIPRYNGVDKEPHWTPAAWNGQYYKTTNAPEYLSSNEITNWKPGKVVEDDR